jgi:hypothetical protein
VKLTILHQLYTQISTATITLTDQWTRFSVSGTCVAGTTRILCYIDVTGIDTGDSFTWQADDVLIEKSAVLTPYFDGTYPDCAWTGTANASTSTRGASVLTYAPPGVLNGATSVTVASRISPLFATASYTSDAMLLQLSTSNNKPYLELVANQVMWVISASGSSVRNPASLAVGSSNSMVCRGVDLTTADLMVNGAAGTQDAAIAHAFSVTNIQIGNWGAGTGAAYAYVGPVAISPSRITDAETVTLDAMLTAGAQGIDLFRFFRDRGYSGTLILPLTSDSVGYVVV